MICHPCSKTFRHDHKAPAVSLCCAAGQQVGYAHKKACKRASWSTVPELCSAACLHRTPSASPWPRCLGQPDGYPSRPSGRCPPQPMSACVFSRLPRGIPAQCWSVVSKSYSFSADKTIWLLFDGSSSPPFWLIHAMQWLCSSTWAHMLLGCPRGHMMRYTSGHAFWQGSWTKKQLKPSRHYRSALGDDESLTKLSAEHPAMAPNSKECAVSSFSGRRPAEHGHHQICTCHTTERKRERERESLSISSGHIGQIKCLASARDPASTLCQCFFLCNVTQKFNLKAAHISCVKQFVVVFSLCQGLRC